MTPPPADQTAAARFDRNSTALEVVAGVDLSGTVAVITGASPGGIGAETARALASAGASIAIGVRDPGRTAGFAEELRSQYGGEVWVGALDLSDPASVADFARAVAERFARIGLLIGNAGVSKTPESHLPSGLDVRFATNHLGHFQLAHALLPNLKAGEARIVMLSSGAHKRRPIVLDDLQWQRREHDALAAYGESKTANILFAMEASRRWGGDGVFANAVLPGTIMTNLQRYHSPELKRQIGFFDAEGRPHPLIKTLEQGAATTVWGAVAPELAGRGGLVLEDCAVAGPAGPDTHVWSGADTAVLREGDAEALWAQSEAILERLGGTLA